ncbi:uncharacterized protein EV422DRAFT_130835 [Fimicolochytrium jonesii]|uniref:uncharacterized protein n=1 Tax=Fimicolochytrium jonesii TaxID=1396493 RepID=UPI0022FE0C66|nr:uncharacterized protein EV422DRAFT_130835 [Fimicolochytrium jonesii]KAI8819041.1 hypothetical protein EV422DRAFT_130835 [Fimicolochytrium jonesii]
MTTGAQKQARRARLCKKMRRTIAGRAAVKSLQRELEKQRARSKQALERHVARTAASTTTTPFHIAPCSDGIHHLSIPRSRTNTMTTTAQRKAKRERMFKKTKVRTALPFLRRKLQKERTASKLAWEQHQAGIPTANATTTTTTTTNPTTTTATSTTGEGAPRTPTSCHKHLSRLASILKDRRSQRRNYQYPHPPIMIHIHTTQTIMGKKGRR